MDDVDESEYDTNPAPSLRAQCASCKGSGVHMRQVAVLQMESDQGGTGLVHTTCGCCNGEGFLAGFESP